MKDIRLITHFPTTTLVVIALSTLFWVYVFFIEQSYANQNLTVFSRIGVIALGPCVGYLCYYLFNSCRAGLADHFVSGGQVRRVNGGKWAVNMSDVDRVCVKKEKYPNRKFLPAREVIVFQLKNGQEEHIWHKHQWLSTDEVLRRLSEAFAAEGHALKIEWSPPRDTGPAVDGPVS